MAKKAEKEVFVQQLSEKLQGVENIFITEYKGLKVPEMNELRERLRSVKCEYQVIKNTLALRAMDKLGFKDKVASFLIGANAFAIGRGDPVETAKVIIKFAQEHESLKVKLGLLEGKTIDNKQVQALSKLPGRNVLLATLASTIQAPLYNFVSVLQAPIRDLVYALRAVEEKRQV